MSNPNIPDSMPNDFGDDHPMVRAALERAAARMHQTVTQTANSNVDHKRHFEIGKNLQAVLIWCALVAGAVALTWIAAR